jgi:hypothetical protein
MHEFIYKIVQVFPQQLAMYSYTFALKYNAYSKGITGTLHEGYAVLYEIFQCLGMQITFYRNI